MPPSIEGQSYIHFPSTLDCDDHPVLLELLGSIAKPTGRPLARFVEGRRALVRVQAWSSLYKNSCGTKEGGINVVPARAYTGLITYNKLPFMIYPDSMRRRAMIAAS